MPERVMPVIQRVARLALKRRGARSRTLVAHGHELHVVDLPGSGPGPTVALLHGLGSSALTFSQVIPGLAKHARRVLAADLPGAGFSPTPASPPTLDGCVRVLEALYERELAGERMVVVGNSLGGAMATELAARRPDLLRGLVLVAPAGAKVDPGRFQQLVQSFGMKSWRDGRDFMRRLYHKAPPLLPELLGADMAAMFGKPHVLELLTGERRANHLEAEVLQKLAMPVLLLWGKSERILPYEGLAYFRENLPGHAVIEEVDGWGHVPHLDAPRELVERIARFMRELPA